MQPVSATRAQDNFQTTVRSAILVDVGTQSVLFEKAADEPQAPASLAKLMTMAVIFEELRQGRLASGPYQVRLDTAFAEVMAACADMPRPGQDGTWIVPAIHRAYGELHELGRAHSVEVWVEERLVGGLYGVAIGRMFYGESMFSRESDASKVALAHLVRFLHSHRFGLIDCQMRTPHLASLGAREIPRGEFEAWLAELTGAPEAYPDGLWPADGARLPPQSPWQD